MANGCNIPLEVEGISPIALDVDSPDAMALDVGMAINQGGGSGGAVNSVNGKTGNVVLYASDVGALPNTTTAADLGAYVKPSGGIPASDLASAVQTSLGKADSALQSVPPTYRTAAAQDTIDAGKLNANQGSGNAGKFMVVGSDGVVVPVTMQTWQGGSY